MDRDNPSLVWFDASKGPRFRAEDVPCQELTSGRLQSELLSSPSMTITNAHTHHPGQFCTWTDSGVHVSGNAVGFHVVKLNSNFKTYLRLDEKHRRLVWRRAGLGARRVQLDNKPDVEHILHYPLNPRLPTTVQRDNTTLAKFWRLRTNIAINLNACNADDMIIILALLGSGMARRTTGRPGIPVPLP